MAKSLGWKEPIEVCQDGRPKKKDSISSFRKCPINKELYERVMGPLGAKEEIAVIEPQIEELGVVDGSTKRQNLTLTAKIFNF